MESALATEFSRPLLSPEEEEKKMLSCTFLSD